MPPVTDEMVAAYQELVAGLAWKYNGRHQAEFDDLFQEGQVAVFEALNKGACPSKEIIVGRMKRWVTKCARHGRVGYDDERKLDEESTLLG